jgi:hypothetical protein
MARGTDHEGLSPLGRHERRPRGLAWPDRSQAGQRADLVHQHLARFAAQLAQEHAMTVDDLIRDLENERDDQLRNAQRTADKMKRMLDQAKAEGRPRLTVDGERYIDELQANRDRARGRADEAVKKLAKAQSRPKSSKTLRPTR